MEDKTIVEDAAKTTYQELCLTLGKRLGAWKAFVVRELPSDDWPVVVESLSLAMPVTCTDIKALARSAREKGRPLIVHNTATWAGCAAVRLGAHLSYEQLTDEEYLVGISRDAESQPPGITEKLSLLAKPTEGRCRMLLDELPTREAAWHAASDTAQVVATYLTCHPRIVQVRYPGLKADPSFAVAARTLIGGFGPTIDYQLQGTETWQRVSYGEEVDPREAVLLLERTLT